MSTLNAGEAGDPAMENLTDLDGYKFHLKFNPSEGQIGGTLTFA